MSVLAGCLLCGFVTISGCSKDKDKDTKKTDTKETTTKKTTE
jgi:hypothetical protein